MNKNALLLLACLVLVAGCDNTPKTSNESTDRGSSQEKTNQNTVPSAELNRNRMGPAETAPVQRPGRGAEQTADLPGAGRSDETKARAGENPPAPTSESQAQADNPNQASPTEQRERMGGTSVLPPDSPRGTQLPDEKTGNYLPGSAGVQRYNQQVPNRGATPEAFDSAAEPRAQPEAGGS